MRNPRSQARAIQLRKRMTDAEICLWQRLRGRQLHGFKFRRQYPVGPFIADFACVDATLIVELDGGQHAEQRLQDESRERFLEARGFRVLRFWNDQVLKETQACLEVISRALCPLPNPPPQAGEGAEAVTSPKVSEGAEAVTSPEVREEAEVATSPQAGEEAEVMTSRKIRKGA